MPTGFNPVTPVGTGAFVRQLASTSAALEAFKTFEVQQVAISAAVTWYRAVLSNVTTRKLTDRLRSFEHGPAAYLLNPQTPDERSVKARIDEALRILAIYHRRALLRVNDAENVQAEVLARVQERLANTPLEVLFELGYPGLHRMAAQELVDVLDTQDARRRGGAGSRNSRKAGTNIRPAWHNQFQNLNGNDPDPLYVQESEIDRLRLQKIQEPATLVLAAARKLGPRAHDYFRAIAAGADQKFAADIAGVSARMARKYVHQLRNVLKTRN